MKRLYYRTERIGHYGWKMHCGHTVLPTKLPLACPHTGLCSVKCVHLPIELEHSAMWAIKKFNIDMAATGSNRKLQLNELEALRNDAYESVKIYKEMTKDFHNKHIRRKSFEPHQKVWLFNSKLRLFPGKLWSRWDGPFVITQVDPHSVVEFQNPSDGRTFKVNGQRLKPYVDGISDGQIIESVDLIYHD